MKKLLAVFGTIMLLIVFYLIYQNREVGKNLDALRPDNMQAATSDYYTELYRPQYHFSTPTGNLADPNGLIYFEGEYHLFHQKNGNWAHAVSKDLLHWEHLPVALEHDTLGQALSGSAVVDWNDSTGFFDGKAGLVAIYTNTEGGEAQSIAYSKDNGRTWERYEGNPVISNPGIKDFRDPKVLWHEETKKWVMVVSTNQSVSFFNSDNLIDWKFQSQFGDNEGSHVAVWECPDLFQLPVDGDKNNKKWVLHVSIGDNDETNGSTAQYFTGEFDGTQFINDNPPEKVLTTDFGQDFYAAQSFSDVPKKDDRRIWLGWMANWRYPYQSPTDPWMGSMSIPRQLSLKTVEDGSIKLIQEPINEIESLRVDHTTVESIVVEGKHLMNEFSGTSYEFEATIEWEDVEEFGIRLRQSEEEETVFGYNTLEGQLFLDRSQAGLETLLDRNGGSFQFGTSYKTDYSSESKQLKIRGFVDESSIEVFVNDGEYTFTNLIYSKPTSNDIEIYSKGGKINVVSLDFYHLYSTWRERPKENEVERIVLSEEYVTLKVGENKTIKAQLKPDWIKNDAKFIWESKDQESLKITQINDSSIIVEAIKPGVSKIEVKGLVSGITKEIRVRVLEK
ncbi:glycoside hydrolase family 32 protein [Bacillus sp. HNG]|uniref:glycoside hydrolase family 32 protein n=1 Tax=Bacillus sp. HNG TaxID=2293325 RepID=UPI000E2ED9FC|nr:glycoside hydrolase family 32 protein [Bacillus sp. HNG]RFB11004.1 glycoside hydrolase family 32 protein [Bacillus sp. HNG]